MNDEDLLRVSVAIEVMGIEVFQASDNGYEKLRIYDQRDKKFELYYWEEGQMIPTELPNYPKNIRDTWEVIGKIREHYQWPNFSAKLKESRFWTYPEQEAATRICLLALGVVRGL